MKKEMAFLSLIKRGRLPTQYQNSLDKIAELYYPLNNQESVALSKLVLLKRVVDQSR